MHVEFYVFENANEQQIHVALCQLIESWHNEQSTIAILCDSLKSMQLFDELLWTFKDQSFIPHNILEKPDTTFAPVLLCLDLAELSQPMDVIINLSKEAISNVKPTKLLVEIVFPLQTMQQLARDRYKQYRDHGFPLKTIKMPVSKVSI